MLQKNGILVCYGWDGAAMARNLAEQAGLAEIIGEKSKKIGINPNLVVARPAEEGATTHPAIAAGLVEYLQANGFYNLVILEGAWLGADTLEAFRACGYEALSRQYGVPLHDTKCDKGVPQDCAGLPLEICDSALALDFLINLPVLKGHCQTRLTCALKNAKGLIPDAEKRRYHTMGLHKPIAHLNAGLPESFTIVDGLCGDLDFEEGGTPVPAGRMLAARDPVLCDAWCAGLLGYGVEDVPYIGLASRLGVGSADAANAKVTELNRPVTPAEKSTQSIRNYSRKIHDKSACSACYAAAVRALSRLPAHTLRNLPEGGVCVGQGWRGQGGEVGVGNCTAGFRHSASGCPPTAAKILEKLEEIIDGK